MLTRWLIPNQRINWLPWCVLVLGSCVISTRILSKVKTKMKKHCQLGDEFISFEIVSRLPIRSLMRFRCVSKLYQSPIHEELKQRTSILLVGKPRYTDQPRCLLTIELLITSSDNEDGSVVSVGAPSKWIVPSSLSQHRISSLDGLICFMDTDNYRACIYNVTTRESTPWIKSGLKKQVDEEQAVYESRLILLKHEFGYDPVTNEYKVVSLWRLYRRNCETDAMSVRVVGEVLTVRQNSWRKIDVVFRNKSPNNVVTSVYMRGSIYWHCEDYSDGLPWDDRNRTSIRSYFIEFDVGSEKFRLIATPPHLTITDRFYTSNLTEIDGILARLLGKTKDIGEQVGPSNANIFETSICLLRHNQKQDEGIISSQASTSTFAGACRNRWTEEIIPMAPYKWKHIPYTWRSDQKDLTIRHVPGSAGLFLIRSLDDDDLSLCYYDWNNKSIGNNKIKLNELSSGLTDENDNFLYYDDFEFYTFTPNLSPAN